MRALGKSIVGVILLLASMHASAVIIPWTVALDGGQEVPSVVTAASGTGFGSVDTVTSTLYWAISASGFISSVDAAHFHEAPIGVNGAVQVDLASGTVVNGGGFVQYFGMAVLTLSQLSAMLDGNFYVNIHTSDHPSGEIRGQVRRVPEPGTLGLLSAGLIALLLLRKRVA